MDEDAISDLSFEFASPADDAELRRLLRETVMPGSVSISMQREPSFFLGAETEGDVHQTVVARLKETGRLVGLGSRAERDAFLNGRSARLGYLSQVRIEPGFRGGKGLLKGGFAMLGETQAASQSEFCVTTIIADNSKARRALAGGWPGLPTYREREVIHSLAIPLWRRRRVPSVPGVTLRQATASDLPEIARCLQSHYVAYQFAPFVTAEELADPVRTRGLEPHDFIVALRGEGIVGCVALWDQLAFKQVVVHGYAGPLKRWRTAVNVAAPLLGIPRLPPPGQAFRFAFLSHLAADVDDTGLWMALLTKACNEAFEKGYGYVSVGLSDSHPRVEEVRKAFRHIDYRAMLYTVHWDEKGAAAVARLDGRVPHVEIATL